MSLNFIDQVLRGSACPEDIDDFVDAWHESKQNNGEIYTFLGMTEEEYQNWSIAPEALTHIIAIRKLTASAKIEMTSNVFLASGQKPN
jgi:uncharacterized protein HemY